MRTVSDNTANRAGGGERPGTSIMIPFPPDSLHFAIIVGEKRNMTVKLLSPQ